MRADPITAARLPATPLTRELCIEYASVLGFPEPDRCGPHPLLAAVLAFPAVEQVLSAVLGAEGRRYMIHIGQTVRLHRPLRTGERFTPSSWVGAGGILGNATMVPVTSALHDETGSTVADLTTVCQTPVRVEGWPTGAVHHLPGGVVHDPNPARWQCATDNGLAVAYARVSGDSNPLHLAPDVAANRGFPAPPLHGMCTLALAGRAAVESLPDVRVEGLRFLGARFANPVLPGDRVGVAFARSGSAVRRFHASTDVGAVLVGGTVEWESTP